MARYCFKPLSLEPFTTNLSKNVSLNDLRNSSKRYLPSPHEFSRYIFRWIALFAFITFDYRYQFQSRLSYNSQQIFRTSYVWLSNAFDSRGNTLSLLINLNARLHFVKLPRHLTEPYTFLSGKPEMSMDSSTSMRNDTYLLTLQVNCATICQMRNTQRRRGHSWLALTIFARKPGKSVKQSERAIYKSAISKQKQTTALHQG